MMLTATKANFQITDMSECLTIEMVEKQFINGYIICKLSIKFTRYWFIYNNREWKCIADFQPNSKLKNLLILKLSGIFGLNEDAGCRIN